MGAKKIEPPEEYFQLPELDLMTIMSDKGDYSLSQPIELSNKVNGRIWNYFNHKGKGFRTVDQVIDNWVVQEFCMVGSVPIIQILRLHKWMGSLHEVLDFVLKACGDHGVSFDFAPAIASMQLLSAYKFKAIGGNCKRIEFPGHTFNSRLAALEINGKGTFLRSISTDYGRSPDCMFAFVPRN